MSSGAGGRRREPGPYEIRIRGHLDPRWSAALGGLAVIALDDGTTVLRGGVIDQAALHGVLRQLRDLGLPLVAVSEVAAAPCEQHPDQHQERGQGDRDGG